MLNEEIKEALEHLNPGNLNYSEWLQVGMALKNEGFTCDTWEHWSASDPERYHPGECERKWESFNGNGIGKGTIFQLCKEKTGHVVRGYDTGGEIDDSYYMPGEITTGTYTFTEPGEDWQPIEDIKQYIKLLFKPADHISYCVQSFPGKDGKLHPGARVYDRTAERLIGELEKAKQIEDVFYTYNHAAGAWITINPVDGKGGGKDNITEYRYALVESDSMSIDEQIERYKQLKLPIVALTYSGSRSAHAIVRIDARDKSEYDQRVKKLFDECEKAGIDVDWNNKDPSRLSRMPGFIRGDHKQFLIDENIGFQSYEEWESCLFVSRLPKEIPMDMMISPPPLKRQIIEGYLREGEALLLSGTPKTGKSFLICQLALAVATGGKWIGKQCCQKTVLYLDGELSLEMITDRFKKIRDRMMIPSHPETLHVINTKASMIRLKDIADDIVHNRNKYGLIIIDPLYMFVGSDENSNSEMKNEMEQISRICATGSAVVVVHHMAKGTQSGKTSIDRASGAGVIGRFFDSILTLNILSSETGDTGKPERIEADTRSFKQPIPIDLWFDGFHVTDTSGNLSYRELNNPQKVTTEKKNADDVGKLNHCYHWMKKQGVLNSDGAFTLKDFKKAYEKCYGLGMSDTTARRHLNKAGYIKTSTSVTEVVNGQKFIHSVNYYVPDDTKIEVTEEPPDQEENSA